MTERRHPRHNPYQLPFEWRGSGRELGQHVREIREPLFVHTSFDAVNYFMNQIFVPFEEFKQEQLYVLLLDQKNRITHDVMVYKGVRRITASHYRVDTTLWEGARNPQVQPT